MPPSNEAEMSTPTHKTGEGGLDKLGLAIEVAKAKGEEPDWDDLAEQLGSASGASLKRTWQNLQKSYVVRRKEKSTTPKKTVKSTKSAASTKVKPAKVTKPRATRKTAAASKAKAKAPKSQDTEEDPDATDYEDAPSEIEAEDFEELDTADDAGSDSDFKL